MVNFDITNSKTKKMKKRRLIRFVRVWLLLFIYSIHTKYRQNCCSILTWLNIEIFYFIFPIFYAHFFAVAAVVVVFAVVVISKINNSGKKEQNIANYIRFDYFFFKHTHSIMLQVCLYLSIGQGSS